MIKTASAALCVCSFDNTGIYESERCDVPPPRPKRTP